MSPTKWWHGMRRLALKDNAFVLRKKGYNVAAKLQFLNFHSKDSSVFVCRQPKTFLCRPDSQPGLCLLVSTIWSIQDFVEEDEQSDVFINFNREYWSRVETKGDKGFGSTSHPHLQSYHELTYDVNRLQHSHPHILNTMIETGSRKLVSKILRDVGICS